MKDTYKLKVRLDEGSGKITIQRGDEEEIPLHNVTAIAIDANGGVFVTMYCHAIDADVTIGQAHAEALLGQDAKSEETHLGKKTAKPAESSDR